MHPDHLPPVHGQARERIFRDEHAQRGQDAVARVGLLLPSGVLRQHEDELVARSPESGEPGVAALDDDGKGPDAILGMVWHVRAVDRV